MALARPLLLLVTLLAAGCTVSVGEPAPAPGAVEEDTQRLADLERYALAVEPLFDTGGPFAHVPAVSRVEATTQLLDGPRTRLYRGMATLGSNGVILYEGSSDEGPTPTIYCSPYGIVVIEGDGYARTPWEGSCSGYFDVARIARDLAGVPDARTQTRADGGLVVRVAGTTTERGDPAEMEAHIAPDGILERIWQGSGDEWSEIRVHRGAREPIETPLPPETPGASPTAPPPEPPGELAGPSPARPLRELRAGIVVVASERTFVLEAAALDARSPLGMLTTAHDRDGDRYLGPDDRVRASLPAWAEAAGAQAALLDDAGRLLTPGLPPLADEAVATPSVEEALRAMEVALGGRARATTAPEASFRWDARVFHATAGPQERITVEPAVEGRWRVRFEHPGRPQDLLCDEAHAWSLAEPAAVARRTLGDHCASSFFLPLDAGPSFGAPALAARAGPGSAWLQREGARVSLTTLDGAGRVALRIAVEEPTVGVMRVEDAAPVPLQPPAEARRVGAVLHLNGILRTQPPSVGIHVTQDAGLPLSTFAVRYQTADGSILGDVEPSADRRIAVGARTLVADVPDGASTLAAGSLFLVEADDATWQGYHVVLWDRWADAPAREY